MQIVDKAHRIPPAKQRSNRIALAVPNLQRQQPPRSKRIPGLWNQPPVHIEPIHSCKQRHPRLKIPDLGMQALALAAGNVGRVRKNGIEAALIPAEPVQKIGFN